MEILGKILRTIALAMLFGGSVATVIVAITLVKAGTAAGLTTSEAAARNAPAFLVMAKVNLGFGIALLIGEGLDYATRKSWNKATVAQYVCSLLCVASTMVFGFGITPPMERLLPTIATSDKAKHEFDQLHETSRIIFGTTIVLALSSLLLPIFGALRKPGTPVSESESA